MSLVVATEPTSLVAVDDQCARVEAWAESCTSIPDLQDANNKLGAIDSYLKATAAEGSARVLAARRRIEVRIGQLIGPASPNGKGSGSFANDPSADALTKDQRHQFRQMADDPDTVEAVIADSTDEAPASRSKVLAAIKNQNEGSNEMDVMDRLHAAAVETGLPVRVPDKSRAGIAARVAKAKALAAEGFSSRQIAAELGFDPRGFASFRKRHGIDTPPADTLVHKTRRLDSDRIVTESIDTLAGVLIGLDLVQMEDLDPDRIADWATSLSNSLRLLNRFQKQLKEMTQ